MGVAGLGTRLEWYCVRGSGPAGVERVGRGNAPSWHGPRPNRMCRVSRFIVLHLFEMFFFGDLFRSFRIGSSDVVPNRTVAAPPGPGLTDRA